MTKFVLMPVDPDPEHLFKAQGTLLDASWCAVTCFRVRYDRLVQLAGVQICNSERAALQGQLAVFRGLAHECLTLIGTLDGECEEAEAELAQLTVRLEKAIEGNLVCPLFI